MRSYSPWCFLEVLGIAEGWPVLLNLWNLVASEHPVICLCVIVDLGVLKGLWKTRVVLGG